MRTHSEVSPFDRRKKPSRPRAVLFVVGFILLVVAAVYGFVRNLEKGPEAIFLKALERTRTKASETIDLELQARFVTSNGLWNVQLSSVSDHIYGSTPRMRASVAASIFGPEEFYRFEDIGADIIITAPDIVYFKLKKPERLFFLNFKPVLDAWVEAKREDFSSADAVSFFKKWGNASIDWRNVFLRSYAKHRFLTFEEIPFDALYDTTRHFQFLADKDIFLQFIDEYARVNTENIQRWYGKKYADAVTDVYALLRRYFERSEVSGNIWIGKDNALRKIKVEVRQKGQENAIASQWTLSLLWKDVAEGGNIEITAPENSIRFPEAFTSVTGIELSKMLDVSALAGDNDDNDNEELGKDSDNDGLEDFMEERLKTDMANPDTDGDGYTDGEEFNNGYNPLGEGKLLP